MQHEAREARGGVEEEEEEDEGCMSVWEGRGWGEVGVLSAPSDDLLDAGSLEAAGAALLLDLTG